MGYSVRGNVFAFASSGRSSWAMIIAGLAALRDARAVRKANLA
jgi:hypothetical protein